MLCLRSSPESAIVHLMLALLWATSHECHLQAQSPSLVTTA